MSILDELAWRGLINDCTNTEALTKRLGEKPVVLYCGFDPTADSLHVGNLVPLIALRRFQNLGHIPIALAGGATGAIGDPSGKSAERSLLTGEALASNIASVKKQLKKLLDFETTKNPAQLLDNADWTDEVTLLDFLRDIGKHFTVNNMVAKESVRARMEDRDAGISFTEFSYMLLQAFDFYHLKQAHDCDLQIGGSDQWGNITAGIDLIRRRAGATAHGLTLPLLTRSDGAKFGKTADAAVWLDPALTLPYELHQYFRNVDDRDVEQYLLRLTLVDVDDVAAVMADHASHPEERLAQQRLADEVCALVHGEDETNRARLAAEGLFAGSAPTIDALDALRGIVPETEVAATDLEGEESLVDALVASGLCSSRGDARRTIGGGGVSVNGVRQDDSATRLPADALVGGRYVLLQKGRRSRHLLIAD